MHGNWQVLVHPLGSFVDTRRVWLKTLPCWLCALVFATPQLFIFVQVEEPHLGGEDRATAHPGTGDDSPLRPALACKSAGYTAEWQRKAYFTFLTAYILVVPTVVMVYCYASIIRVIWLRSRSCRRSPRSRDDHDDDDDDAIELDRPRIHFVSAHKAGVTTSPAPGDWGRQCTRPPHTSAALRRAASFQPYQRRPRPDSGGGGGGGGAGGGGPSAESRFPLSSKRSVVKMTMLVVAGFVLCWTPYFVVSLIRIYSDYRIELSDALSLSEIMALGHSAVNPLLYMIYSRRAVRTFCWQVRRRARCHWTTTDRGGDGDTPEAAWTSGDSVDRLGVVLTPGWFPWCHDEPDARAPATAGLPAVRPPAPARRPSSPRIRFLPAAAATTRSRTDATTSVGVVGRNGSGSAMLAEAALAAPRVT